MDKFTSSELWDNVWTARCRLSLIVVVLLASLLGCGGGSGSGISFDKFGGAASIELSNVTAWDSSGSYHDVLQGCIKVERDEYCTVNQLPLLVQVTGITPSKSAIQQRLVVSHDWMGLRFMALLDELPDDIRTLLGSVSAIVIGSEIRPSFYYPLTGAIYLDPSRLWLTNTEKQTISQRTDFRSDFDQELNFAFLSRYLEGGVSAFPYYPLDGDEERQLQDIVKPMARLLYHELAHAADFFPRLAVAGFDGALTLDENAQNLHLDVLSDQLVADIPLNNSVLDLLGKVMFQGEQATLAQQSFSPSYVGAEFTNDGAAHMYAYSTQFEDFAMLFEQSMMKYHYNLVIEVAVTNYSDSIYCNDYSVVWGQINRIADGLVKPRAKKVAELVFPEEAWGGVFDGLGVAVNSSAGESWCDRLANRGGENKEPLVRHFPDYL
ncbi:MAG: hypothetical protein COA99_08160 [Moraxellaceae bacterium]|nr:MAG: hypothetical protein COA99_08160 [Moraxellaceae bacterium]